MIVLMLVSCCAIVVSFVKIKKFTMIRSDESLNLKVIMLHILCFILAAVSTAMVFLTSLKVFQGSLMSSIKGAESINIVSLCLGFFS